MQLSKKRKPSSKPSKLKSLWEMHPTTNKESSPKRNSIELKSVFNLLNLNFKKYKRHFQDKIKMIALLILILRTMSTVVLLNKHQRLILLRKFKREQTWSNSSKRAQFIRTSRLKKTKRRLRQLSAKNHRLRSMMFSNNTILSKRNMIRLNKFFLKTPKKMSQQLLRGLKKFIRPVMSNSH